MAEFKRIPRQRVADEVYEIIRQAILDRDFEPGERLDIPSLARRFDVSQMPVRQAIHRLSGAGLVEIRPRSGTFVAKLTPKEARDTFAIRKALECLAAEQAIAVITDKDVEKLAAIVADMESLHANGNGSFQERHDELNSAFHRTIVALSDNQKLEAIYDELNAHIKIARIHFATLDWPRRIELEQQEHREILEALDKRDAAAAVDALSRHIDRGMDALTRDLEQAETQTVGSQAGH